MHNPGYFTYRGRSSLDFGLVVDEIPSFSRPAQKHTVYEIPGRNGPYVEKYKEWENFEKSYSVWFPEEDSASFNYGDKVREIAEWLYSESQSYITLQDNFDPDFCRLAYFVGPLDIETKLLKYGRCTIVFNCRPENFKTDTFYNYTSVNLSNPAPLYNPFRFEAKPLIELIGTGTIEFSIHDQEVQINNLPNHIYIDCDAMKLTCYDQNNRNLNNLMVGDFPVLYPGINQIEIISGNGLDSFLIAPNFWTI